MDRNFYRQVRVAGLLLFIPVILVSAPVAGFVIGDILEKRLGWAIAVPVCLSIFTIVSLVEVIRLLKLVVRAQGT